MSYEVRREIEAVGTANAASEGAARSDATETVVSAIEAADEGELDSVAVTAASVYDFPAAPFDPYRFHLTTTVAVTVALSPATIVSFSRSASVTPMLAAAATPETPIPRPPESAIVAKTISRQAPVTATFRPDIAHQAGRAELLCTLNPG